MFALISIPHQSAAQLHRHESREDFRQQQGAPDFESALESFGHDLHNFVIVENWRDLALAVQYPTDRHKWAEVRHLARNLTPIDDISRIIQSVMHKSKEGSVQKRRLDALRERGFEFSDPYTIFNFGRAGDVKITTDGIVAQIGCATGRRAKNGYSVNACPCVKINYSLD